MMATGYVRRVTAGGHGAPTTKRRGPGDYNLIVPRSATSTGPHGVSPGTGHVSYVNGGRSVHPAINLPAPTRVGPRIPTPQHPPRGRPRGGPGVHNVTIHGPAAGTVTEIGGFVQQTNAGGTTSGVGGGGAAIRAATGGTGYFNNAGSGDLLGKLGISWVTAAEVAALAVGGYLVFKHFSKPRGRR